MNNMSKEKAVLFVYSGGVKEVLLNENARDNCTEPYLRLKSGFEGAGYRFDWERIMDLEMYEWIIFLDVGSFGRRELYRRVLRKIKNFILGKPIYNIYEESVKKKLFDKMVLLLVEPPSVNEDNYDKTLHQNFALILTWNDKLVDNKKYFKYRPPVTSVFPDIPEVPFEKKKLLANISRNKTSSNERELYSKRIETIRYFEAKFPDMFDLYGTGWNNVDNSGAAFPSYRGEVKNKWDVLPNYKFCLAYENIYGESGYISEKIFDAIRCGTVPIYLGAENVADYIPEKVFIDRRMYKSDAELADYISNMSETEYQEYRDRGKTFLAGKEFKLFLSEYYVDSFLKLLKIN